ncbi:PRTRC system protein C [Flagellimonas sp.]|uniref:PRTRC system protein C n=1 Tax=Flagellimonas sp. TaxID=2058762 RepID=UPI003AB2C9A4
MMLIATILPRVFFFKEGGNQVELADPDPQWSTETVLHFYANTYPVLNNARIEGPQVRDDRMEYHFNSVMGTKG